MRIMKSRVRFLNWMLVLLLFSSCRKDEGPAPVLENDNQQTFIFGADLSYTNQMLDHGGVFKLEGEMKTPYKIFKEKGANLVRLRLWHNPSWTKEVYGTEGTQLYNDLKDVEKSISLAKEQKHKVLLDFHYSDSWADPAKQEIPAAWIGIRSLAVLKDSVYQYTFKTLRYLDQKGLMPEMVQLGNETNCGMFYSNAPDGFPFLNVCNGQWANYGEVINAAIKAVKDASSTSTTKPKIALHVADPKNVDWWFTSLTSQGKVSDFDIIGFSYYPIWHTTVKIDNLATSVSFFKTKFKKEIMMLETAFPWTDGYNDSYNNAFGGSSPFASYPFTQQGQYDFYVAITQAMIGGGGSGIIVWEPDWISSQMKDQWGTGSSYENCAFFDFAGNPVKGFDFMKYEYKKK